MGGFLFFSFKNCLYIMFFLLFNNNGCYSFFFVGDVSRKGFLEGYLWVSSRASSLFLQKMKIKSNKGFVFPEGNQVLS